MLEAAVLKRMLDVIALIVRPVVAVPVVLDMRCAVHSSTHVSPQY